MKMLGELPPASVKKYLELTKVQELADKEYSAAEVLKNVLEAYKFLKEESTELRSLADAEGDFVTLARAEGYIGELNRSGLSLQCRDNPELFQDFSFTTRESTGAVVAAPVFFWIIILIIVDSIFYLCK